MIHPAAPSRRSTVPLAAARNVKRTKRNKYTGLADQRGAGFLAFVVETFGAFGSQAICALQLIASQGARFSLVSRDVRARALPAQLLSVAI